MAQPGWHARCSFVLNRRRKRPKTLQAAAGPQARTNGMIRHSESKAVLFGWDSLKFGQKAPLRSAIEPRMFSRH
ncbi:MAG TPA: hypothetical protein DCL54_14725, partial [Alphaproteobacteria bacterium]|nr:hypothetical protein [Alphaproteobacteria bacterium]